MIMSLRNEFKSDYVVAVENQRNKDKAKALENKVLKYLHDHKHIDDNALIQFHNWKSSAKFESEQDKIYDFLQSPRGQFYLKHLRPVLFNPDSNHYPYKPKRERIRFEDIIFENQRLLYFIDSLDKIQALQNPYVFLYLMVKSHFVDQSLEEQQKRGITTLIPEGSYADSPYTASEILSIGTEDDNRVAMAMIKADLASYPYKDTLESMKNSDPTGVIQGAFTEITDMEMRQREALHAWLSKKLAEEAQQAQAAAKSPVSVQQSLGANGLFTKPSPIESDDEFSKGPLYRSGFY